MRKRTARPLPPPLRYFGLEPEARERFERIEALLHAMVERDRLEERMEKFDRQLQAAASWSKRG